MCNSSHAGTFVDQTGSSTVLITCCFKFRLSQECHTASQVFKKKEETEPPITLKQQMVSPQSTYPRFVHKQMRNRPLDLRKKQLNSARNMQNEHYCTFLRLFYCSGCVQTNGPCNSTQHNAALIAATPDLVRIQPRTES